MGTPVSATFSVAATDFAEADTVSAELAQTFAICQAGHPGSVTLTLKLLSSTQLITSDWDMYVDLYDLGARNGASSYNLPAPADATGECDDLEAYGAANAFARGRFNTKALLLGVDTTVKINFLSLPGTQFDPTHEYAFVVYMESPGINRIGIASTDDSRRRYTDGFAYTRQLQILRPQCLGNTPWTEDAIRDVDFQMTLDDGCVVGNTLTCGQGACSRTIEACDSYGNFQQCNPGSCTTDQDCVWSWTHPPSPAPSDWLPQVLAWPSGPQPGAVTVDADSDAPSASCSSPGLVVTIVDPQDFSWTYPGSSSGTAPIPAGSQYCFGGFQLGGICLDFSNGTFVAGETCTITWTGTGASAVYSVQCLPSPGTVTADPSSDPSESEVSPGIEITIVDPTHFTYTYDGETSQVTPIPAGGTFSGPWFDNLTGIALDFSAGSYVAGEQWTFTWNSAGPPYTWDPQFTVSESGTTPGSGAVSLEPSSSPNEVPVSPGLVLTIVDPGHFTAMYENDTSAPIPIPMGTSYAGPWPGSSGLRGITVDFSRGTYTTGSIYTITWRYFGWYGPGSCVNPGGAFNAGHCIGQQEQCNGIDDDCNGATDEGLGDVTCGAGACSTTVYSCTDSLDGGITIGAPTDCESIVAGCDGGSQ
jgi:hypothetical protein